MINEEELRRQLETNERYCAMYHVDESIYDQEIQKRDAEIQKLREAMTKFVVSVDKNHDIFDGKINQRIYFPHAWVSDYAEDFREALGLPLPPSERICDFCGTAVPWDRKYKNTKFYCSDNCFMGGLDEAANEEIDEYEDQ